MKSLLLMRHAKSSWDDPTLADHDRPLKSRGIKAARRMGQLVCEQSLPLDMVICSTAVRARQTLELMFDESKSTPIVQFSEQLFHCPVSDFGVILRQINSNPGSLMLVGHNPGLEEFVAQVIGKVEHFPTAALAHVKLDLADWSQFGDSIRGELVGLWRPKELARTE